MSDLVAIIPTVKFKNGVQPHRVAHVTQAEADAIIKAGYGHLADTLEARDPGGPNDVTVTDPPPEEPPPAPPEETKTPKAIVKKASSRKSAEKAE